jgi:hypothetical protein
VDSGALEPGDAYKLFYQQKLEAAKPKNNYLSAGGSLYNTDSGQWLTPPQNPLDKQEVFYGNPVPFQTPNGIQYGQIGSKGSFKPIDIGQGNTFAPPVKAVDTGTAVQFVGPGAANIGSVSKDLAGAERDKEMGTQLGKQIAAAPADYQAGQNALDAIQSIRTDPYKSRGTGFSSILNGIPGTGGYDFANKVAQAKSGAFLTAIQQMRGLGSLSNAEGGAATAAVNRMNTATSEDEFNSALDDYEKIVRQGMARAQAKMQQGGMVTAPDTTPSAAPNTVPQAAPTQNRTSSGVSWSVGP